MTNPLLAHLIDLRSGENIVNNYKVQEGIDKMDVSTLEGKHDLLMAISIPKNSNAFSNLENLEKIFNSIANDVKLPEAYEKKYGKLEEVKINSDNDRHTLSVKEPLLGAVAQLIELPKDLDLKIVEKNKDLDLKKYPALGSYQLVQREAEELTETYKDTFKNHIIEDSKADITDYKQKLLLIETEKSPDHIKALKEALEKKFSEGSGKNPDTTLEEHISRKNAEKDREPGTPGPNSF